jgi:hypothetical protein
LVEDLARGRAADALGEQFALAAGQVFEAASHLPLDQRVEE